MPARLIAVLGAECTGKSTLAATLAEALASPGRRVARVDEFLREWCDRAGRTPRPDEQAAIAAEQHRRIEAAATTHDMVVCDTTALMTAVYSDLLFDDPSLYSRALAQLAPAAVRLVMAIDLPWQADGLQRDGPQVQAPVDDRLRAALAGASQPFSVVHGRGGRRLENALAAIEAALRPRAGPPATSPWSAACELCGDAACERHLFRRLQPPNAPGGR
jgi:nicotinamide riboside kinase